MTVKEGSPSRADVADTTTTSTKRKSAGHEEIEVDLSAPEPPSKRARRALKKGKALPKKPSSDADKEDSDAEKKDKVRSEHSIWVGNLPFTVTPADLRRWLVDNSGQVITPDSITRIKLPTVREPGRDKTKPPVNKGFAYVDFADLAPKVAAIALSETDYQSRRLLIKDAKSFEGRPKREKESVKDGAADAAAGKDVNASRKVFVGNMSFKTTDEDLTRNFEKCGEIEWVKVATFEDTGKCKGFGWVKFKEAEAAAWAVKGFVKIKEEVEADDDFKSDDDDEGGSDAGDKQPQPPQSKTRKWWVNRLLGRQLKLELAEDDQTRYKKRFGKDAPKRDGPPKASASRDAKQRSAGGAGGRADGAADKGSAPLREASDIRVAKLTGALVKHTGTKVTFG